MPLNISFSFQITLYFEFIYSEEKDKPICLAGEQILNREGTSNLQIRFYLEVIMLC